MRKQVKHISVHQSSKVIALLYFLIALIICIPVSAVIFIYGDKTQAVGFLIAPFAYLVVSYILFSFVSWIYNRIANVFGGIEFTIETIDENKVEIKK
jgi:hypothetical protein